VCKILPCGWCSTAQSYIVGGITTGLGHLSPEVLQFLELLLAPLKVYRVASILR